MITCSNAETEGEDLVHFYHVNDIGVNIGRHRGKVGGPGNETSFSACSIYNIITVTTDYRELENRQKQL